MTCSLIKTWSKGPTNASPSLNCEATNSISELLSFMGYMVMTTNHEFNSFGRGSKHRSPVTSTKAYSKDTYTSNLHALCHLLAPISPSTFSNQQHCSTPWTKLCG
ncbi:Uncharacterized protein TCM_042699 [Theobroma cacao]|uniref:Uncharacterized protein n=1 Tax=Theobroma cacao TaxID=3641 RepID=A0A061FMW9_THECC|nr:Uncharacterized protein TCM_042699 [Theobroma cacao]